jgi:hypothetical protein
MSTPSEAEQVLLQAVSRSKAAKQAAYTALRATIAANSDDTIDAASKAALAAASNAAVAATYVAEEQVLAADLIVAFESSAKAFADTIESGLKVLRMEKMKAAHAAMVNAKKDKFTCSASIMVENNPVIYTAMVNAGMAHSSVHQGLDYATGVNAIMRQELGLVTAVKADSSTKADVPTTVSQWV